MFNNEPKQKKLKTISYEKLVLFFILFPLLTYAQNDPLSGVDVLLPKKKLLLLKALKIVNLESTKAAAKAICILFVAHRFGSYSDGFGRVPWFG